MANQFVDASAHYSNAQLTTKWSSASGSVNGPATTYGRGGRYGIRLYYDFGFTSSGSLARSLTANLSTIYMGCAVRPLTFTSGELPVMAWYDGANCQCELRICNDGSLKFYRGAGTTSLGQSSPGLITTFGTHTHVAAKVVFSNTVGTLDVQLNGVTVWSLTGLDNCVTANEYCSIAVFGNSYWETAMDGWYCDFYINDTTGAAWNSFMGDLTFETLYPNGDDSIMEFTPDTGVVGYSRVNESPASTAEYVSDSTAGHRARFTATDLVATVGAVAGVAITDYSKKDSAGTRTHSHLLVMGGTQGEGAAYAPATSEAFHQTMFSAKPAGGAIAIADVNAMIIGFKIAS